MPVEWLLSWPLATKDLAPSKAENSGTEPSTSLHDNVGSSLTQDSPHGNTEPASKQIDETKEECHISPVGASPRPSDSGGGKLVTTHEHKLIRDWVRTVEDLLALQIVRWFAPALSQFLPIMTFLVLGSLSLLLAVSSYPFDQQGWLMTVMVFLILFVAAVVGNVLVGVNRNEFISRVSGTTPGRLTFDGQFVSSLLTTIVPLFAALLAISFDLSDILHTLFGPLFQAL